MADCCAPSDGESTPQRKRRCPANGREYAEVPNRTVAHHVRQAWRWLDPGRRYFFCDDPDCDVVYFADDDSVIGQSQLRTPVGAKGAADDALVCYCFGITRAEARDDPAARDFVLAQTKRGSCACETRNPSGRCCLKNFPRGGGMK